MSETQTQGGRLVVSRKFSAPAERVFDAWIDPVVAGKWLFATPTGEMMKVEIDARAGGKFNFTERRDEVDVAHVGEYIELERPKRLVFTFGVPMYSAVMTRVTIDIVARGAGCELTLTHEGVEAEWHDKTREGWGMLLGALGRNVEKGSDTADREIISTRVFDAPRELVWRAWTEPEHLAKWWGPKGFTNTFHQFEFKAGGVWQFTMHGSDGTDFHNKSAFVEIVEPERIVFDHLEPMHKFRVMASFVDRADKTEVIFQMVFDSAAECARVKGYVVEGNEQNFDKLAAELRNMA